LQINHPIDQSLKRADQDHLVSSGLQTVTLFKPVGENDLGQIAVSPVDRLGPDLDGVDGVGLEVVDLGDGVADFDAAPFVDFSQSEHAVVDAIAGDSGKHRRIPRHLHGGR